MANFKENDGMKNKIYLSDYIVYDNNYYPIIVITYNYYILYK